MKSVPAKKVVAARKRDHIHDHGDIEVQLALAKLERKLTTQIKNLGARIMAKLDDLKTQVAGLTTGVETLLTSHTEIKGDIQEILDKLPSEGGIDAAGVAELSALLTSAQTKMDAAVVSAREAADMVPEPEDEEEPPTS